MMEVTLSRMLLLSSFAGSSFKTDENEEESVRRNERVGKIICTALHK